VDELKTDLSENTQKASDISEKVANRRDALQQQSFVVKRARSSAQESEDAPSSRAQPTPNPIRLLLFDITLSSLRTEESVHEHSGSMVLP
jgi:hypothetical protein